MNPTPAPKAPLPLRLFRSLVILSLVLAFTLIAALAYAGAAFSAVATYFQDARKPPGAVLFTLWVLVTLLPLGLAVLAARRNWLKWPVLATGSLTAGVILTWLAWDDADLHRPPSIEEISPVFDGAELSYAVVMEYGKQRPTEEAKAFANYKPKAQFTAAAANEPEKWIEFLTKNRAALEADWEAAAPQRAWLGRLNAFDRLGDLTPADYAADIPSFFVWRFLSQRTCAIASLQALDGRGDEAIATLLPMLEVSRKFETSSRTLVRTMIARVIQKMCYQNAAFILERGKPGAAARARLLAAIESGNPEAGARRLVLTEYTVFSPLLAKVSFADTVNAVTLGGKKQLPGVLNLLTRFVLNPRATMNLYGDYIYELADLAERRELGSFAARQEAFVRSALQGGMKNLGGHLLLNMAVPAYQKILQNYWDTEDLRLALCDELVAKP